MLLIFTRKGDKARIRQRGPLDQVRLLALSFLESLLLHLDTSQVVIMDEHNMFAIGVSDPDMNDANMASTTMTDNHITVNDATAAEEVTASIVVHARTQTSQNRVRPERAEYEAYRARVELDGILAHDNHAIRVIERAEARSLLGDFERDHARTDGVSNLPSLLDRFRRIPAIIRQEQDRALRDVESRDRTNQAWLEFGTPRHPLPRAAPVWFRPMLIDHAEVRSIPGAEGVVVLEQHIQDLDRLRTYFIQVVNTFSAMIQSYPDTKHSEDLERMRQSSLVRLREAGNTVCSLLWDIEIECEDYPEQSRKQKNEHREKSKRHERKGPDESQERPKKILLVTPVEWDLPTGKVRQLPDQPFAEFQKLQEKEQALESVREALHFAEMYLIKREKDKIQGSWTDFAAYASRYERARLRYNFQHVLSEIVTPHLRGIVELNLRLITPRFAVANYEKLVSKSPQKNKSALKTQKGMRDNDCQICHDDLAETDASRVITYQCCRRAFHVDCLLSWLLIDFHVFLRRGCPHCREELDLGFLGQVLEVKVRALDVL